METPMKPYTLGFALLTATVACVQAELLLPMGRDLPLPHGAQTDTLDAETFVTGSYLIPGLSESQSLLYWRNRLPLTKFTFNSQTKQYLSHDKGIVVRYDSAGLTYQVLADSRYDAGGAVHTVTYRGYDTQRRQVVEYVHAGLTNPVLVDSTRWVWNHPGCADEFRADSRWTWNVDSTGHCADGSFLMPDPTSLSGWSEDHRLKLQWQGRLLVAAFEVVYGDTLARDEYVYNRDSLVQSISTYCLGSSWYLAENTSFTYSAGRMLKRTAQGFDSTGSMFAKATLAARAISTGVQGPAGVRSGAAVAVRREGGRLHLSNPTTESVVFSLVGPDGSRVGVQTVAAGQILDRELPAGCGTVIWSARGNGIAVTGSVSGTR